MKGPRGNWRYLCWALWFVASALGAIHYVIATIQGGTLWGILYATAWGILAMFLLNPVIGRAKDAYYRWQRRHWNEPDRTLILNPERVKKLFVAGYTNQIIGLGSRNIERGGKFALRADVVKWCAENNCQIPSYQGEVWNGHPPYLIFANANDAFAFKMRWF